MVFSKPIAALGVCLITLALTACGGGSSSNVIDGGGGSAQIEKPRIGTQPASQSVVVGQSATFTVAATGSEAGGALVYQWKKGGTDIAGATNSSYTIQATSMADGGAYSVAVSNSAGATTSTEATLTVTAAAGAPAISTQPASKTVTAGQAATFTVTATGTAPLAYQWKKNGTAVSGATSSTYTTPATSMGDSSAVFTVVVSNGTGTVTSSNATLTVTAAAGGAPAIGTQPAAQSVTAGQAATFTVAATGTAPLAYQWKKNGTDISGATSSTYTTPATAIGDDGAVISVVITNSAGTATSSNATLTVTAAAVAPTITTQPLTQTVAPGKPVTFSVVATGTGTLSYQWKRGGTDISGANSASYEILVTAGTDNGVEFSVVVSNSAGPVTSSVATLTVSKYSEVANASGGTYTKEECVKDNGTGLVWEGKPTTGTARLASTKYTNYDDATKFQKQSGATYSKPDPTTDIAAITNSIGYRNSVNTSGLCGFSDWRLPTKDELLGIHDLSQSPKIDNVWFPNTLAAAYWSSTPGAAQYVVAILDTVQTTATSLNFGIDYSGSSIYEGVSERGATAALRLVRP